LGLQDMGERSFLRNRSITKSDEGKAGPFGSAFFVYFLR